MFTGLIRHLGTVTAADVDTRVTTCAIEVGDLAARLVVGDSVAVNGVCLTVKTLLAETADFTVSSETLAKCLIGEWPIGTVVNLEPAVTLQTPLGGHLVSGHVDGTTTLIARHPQADCAEFVFEVAPPLQPFIAHKGSVAIDGISLTSHRVEDCSRPSTTRFAVSVIPHTLANTTLGQLAVGARTHIEVDLIARYIHRFRAFPHAE